MTNVMADGINHVVLPVAKVLVIGSVRDFGPGRSRRVVGMPACDVQSALCSGFWHVESELAGLASELGAFRDAKISDIPCTVAAARPSAPA
jgi:hypothetical protein